MSSHAATFALLNRALREDNRLKQTYVTRCGLVCFVLLMLFTTHMSSGFNGAPGRMFFGEIIWLNLWFISITGLSYFAAAIAEEKEETTLGLLRMTNLGPLTILLGKSTSRLLGVALLLSVQLPFTLLAVTLGGVSAHQILAGYVALGAYIFFLCNLALVFSVIFNRVGTASAMTFLALVAFFSGPALGEASLKGLIYLQVVTAQTAWVRGARWLLESLGAASPSGRLKDITSTSFSGGIIGYQTLADIFLGLLCFGLAWAGFERFTRERREAGGGPASDRTGRARRPFRLWMWGASRPWRLGTVVWKDFFLVHGGLSMYLLQIIGFVVLTVALWYGNTVTMTRQRRLVDFGGEICWISLAVCAVTLAVGCARIFRVEIQGKTLAGLITTPASVTWIAWQKVGALCLSLLPAAVFALGGFVFYVINNHRAVDFYLDRVFDLNVFEGVAATAIQFVLFLYVTAYFSLRLKRLALPLAIMACFLGNTLAVSFMGSLFFRGSSEAALFFYHLMLVGVILALNFVIDARLRALAAEES